MVDATYDAAFAAQASAASRRYFVGRIGVYLFLTVFALIYLLPLFVIVFGIGAASKIAFGVSHGVFPIIMAVAAGVPVKRVYLGALAAFFRR